MSCHQRQKGDGQEVNLHVSGHRVMSSRPPSHAASAVITRVQALVSRCAGVRQGQIGSDTDTVL